MHLTDPCVRKKLNKNGFGEPRRQSFQRTKKPNKFTQKSRSVEREIQMSVRPFRLSVCPPYCIHSSLKRPSLQHGGGPALDKECLWLVDVEVRWAPRPHTHTHARADRHNLPAAANLIMNSHTKIKDKCILLLLKLSIGKTNNKKNKKKHVLRNHKKL